MPSDIAATSLVPSRHPHSPLNAGAPPLIGMHGQCTDWIGARSLLYHLGNGARSYDPTLQSFLSKDPYSPFSYGGINPYSFCGGDPVNRSDPSGYISLSAGVGLGLGIFGFILGAVTFGLGMLLALPVAGALLMATASVLSLASSATGIAAAFTERSDPELARTLGWISLGLGIISAAVGMPGPVLTAYAKASGRFVVGRLFSPLRPSAARNGNAFMFMPRYRDGSLVITHGGRRALQSFDGDYLSPSLWADELSELPAYSGSPPGSPLYLMACNAAATSARYPVSNAQLVANALRRSVLSFNSPSTYRVMPPMPAPIPRLVVGYGSTWGKLLQFTPG
ncbi:RHS repeat-associated core domain-containing protein [Microvirgula aerodenitrificans]|uniref:RHS repeat-associated core domain-containing protein n=1 Tax=Microvirgula aerodenitrificans TaxID=57480 RepID=UPI00248E9A36|nr:RHS repeat-associated core domain-containing protein [Microvirgula aerodenitrificans]